MFLSKIHITRNVIKIFKKLLSKYFSLTSEYFWKNEYLIECTRRANQNIRERERKREREKKERERQEVNNLQQQKISFKNWKKF